MKNLVALLLLAAAPLAAQTAEPRAVVPVVGSTAGGFGAQFRTDVQIHNRGEVTQRGRLVFRLQGTAGEAAASMPYELAPKQTLHYPDLVAAMGSAGLGSLDVMADEGGIPAVVARAFADGGEIGTSGTSVPLIDPRDAVAAGAPVLLILPADLGSFRFNVGIRTLAQGVHYRLTIYGESGIARSSREESLAPHLFLQRPAADVAGEALLANESLLIEVLSGAALFYGTTTDNRTNDPAIQIAQ